MRLSSRSTLILWLVAAFAAPGLLLYFATLLNVTDLDPTLGDSNYSALYGAEGRFARGTENALELHTVEAGGKRLLQTGGADGLSRTPIADDGTVGRETYSIFWIHLANPITKIGSQKTAWQARVSDGPGLLGAPGKTYTAKGLEKFIWWDYVLSSQASYSVGIYDGRDRVATAIYDMTCGMLFELVPNVGGWGRLHLVKTDFPISRNRYMLLYSALLFCVVILGWYGMKFLNCRKTRRYKAVDNLWYAVAIALTILIDYIYDSWFFAAGDAVTIALHAAAIAILAIRYNLWVVPMALELAWVFAYTLPTGGHLAPGVTYFPSMLVTTAMVIMFRKTPKPPAAR